ncbi:hypothetical protein ACP70R_034642 [Stipagrostis hirtigluma subsp. patula]
MALSLGGGRRRWAGRAGCGGGRGGGARCRHFHVHYHLPRSQVCAFLQSPWSLPRLSLLCGGLLILPVLFFAVVAFLVCFGWFTLVYFVSSLLSKGSGRECFKSGSVDRVRDADELRGEDEHGGEKEERRDMMNRVTEPSARDSAASEVCVERLEIKEVFVDGFFDDSRGISPDFYLHHNDHAIHENLVKEVMVFETKREGLKSISGSDGSSEMQQVPDILVDWSLGELDVREFSNPRNVAQSHRVEDGGEFFGKRKVVEACISSPNFDSIDKYETTMEVAGSVKDFIISEVAYSDGSISVDGGLGEEQKNVVEQEYNVKGAPEMPVDCVADLEDPDELHEVQKAVTDHNMLPESESMEEKGKQIVSISDDDHYFSNESETYESLPDAGCENKYISVDASNDCFHRTNAYEDVQNEKDLIENNKLEVSITTSLVRDFAENHQTMKEENSASPSEDNVHEDTSLETSVPERIEDADEKIDVTSKHVLDCRSSGGPQHRGGTYVESLMCLLAVKIKLRVSKAGQEIVRFIGASDHQTHPI